MASRPKLRKLSRLIQQQGGDRFILDRIADGESVGRIAKSITLPGEATPISRPFLYSWAHADDDRWEGWQLAVKHSGEALAEKAGDVFEDLPEGFDKDQLGKAKAQSEYYRWMARMRDREGFGDRQSPDTVVNILSVGEQHLAALMEKGQRHIAGPEPLEIPAEIVEEDA
jgi:hypothetical protein